MAVRLVHVIEARAALSTYLNPEHIAAIVANTDNTSKVFLLGVHEPMVVNGNCDKLAAALRQSEHDDLTPLLKQDP